MFLNQKGVLLRDYKMAGIEEHDVCICGKEKPIQNKFCSLACYNNSTEKKQVKVLRPNIQLTERQKEALDLLAQTGMMLSDEFSVVWVDKLARVGNLKALVEAGAIRLVGIGAFVINSEQVKNE